MQVFNGVGKPQHHSVLVTLSGELTISLTSLANRLFLQANGHIGSLSHFEPYIFTCYITYGIIATHIFITSCSLMVSCHSISIRSNGSIWFIVSLQLLVWSCKLRWYSHQHLFCFLLHSSFLIFVFTETPEGIEQIIRRKIDEGQPVHLHIEQTD